MINGFFGDMFDFNNDGNLDYFEQTVEFTFLNELTNDSSDDLEDNKFI